MANLSNYSNTLDNNYVEKLLKGFIAAFEHERVVSKVVNKQVLKGEFNAKAGDILYMKKPHRYVSVETVDGNITDEASNEIKTAKVAAKVQKMITVTIPWTGYEQSLKIDDLPNMVFKPAAQELATKQDNNILQNIMKYASLISGDRGTPISTWKHVASADALLDSIGASKGNRYMLMNPYTCATLAGAQLALPNGNGGSNASAWEKAQMSADLGGFHALKASNIPVYHTGTASDRVGTIFGNIDTAYDTYAQSVQYFQMTIADLTNGEVIMPYQTVTIPSIYRLNQSSRTMFLDEAGDSAAWTGVIMPNPGTSDGSYTVGIDNSVQLRVSAPIIHEKTAEVLGQYDTVESKPSSGDVVNISAAVAGNKAVQPNIFFHRDAFVVGSVPISPIEGLATKSATSDGLQIRMTFVPDGLAYKQRLRVDLWPAFGVVNPEMAGQCFGY